MRTTPKVLQKMQFTIDNYFSECVKFAAFCRVQKYARSRLLKPISIVLKFIIL